MLKNVNLPTDLEGESFLHVHFLDVFDTNRPLYESLLQRLSKSDVDFLASYSAFSKAILAVDKAALHETEGFVKSAAEHAVSL